MKERMIRAHMDVAEVYAKLSHARRLKVGCIIVKNNRVLSIGYNGMPAGWDNDCEDLVEKIETCYLDEGATPFPIGSLEYKTKPEVLHAEMNAIGKLAGSHESGKGATAFITHAPCIECAKLLFTAGIKNVYYGKQYRNDQGIKFLERSNVKVQQVTDDKT